MAKEVETLTKKVLVEELAEKYDMTKKAATEVVNDVFESMRRC